MRAKAATAIPSAMRPMATRLVKPPGIASQNSLAGWASRTEKDAGGLSDGLWEASPAHAALTAHAPAKSGLKESENAPDADVAISLASSDPSGLR